MQQRPKKLLEQVRDVMRLKHYAYRTEETYVQWIRRYILFHNKRHPIEIGKVEIEASLTSHPSSCAGAGRDFDVKSSTQYLAVSVSQRIEMCINWLSNCFTVAACA